MKMKTDPTQHLTIAQYSADLTADGMVDPMLSDALNAISSKTFQVQFGGWDGSPAANAEQALVLTGTVDTVDTSAKMLEVIATGGEQLTLDSNHSLFVGVLDYASTVDGRGSTGSLTMELGGNNELAYGGQGADVITCYGTNDQIIL